VVGTRRLPALALVGTVALLLSACGGDSEPKTLDLASAEAIIRSRAAAAFGDDADIGAVRCPGKVQMEQGASFGCTVQVDDQALPYVVRLTNDSGGTRVELGASLLVTEKVEQFIADYAADNNETVRSVDCGSTKYLVRARGTKVSCEVVRSDGSTIPAVVGVRDTQGNTALISFGPTKADG
jgi:hypothetical protein